MEKELHQTTRAGNLTAAERVRIVELVEKYWAVVECKQSDTVTLKQKLMTWKTITDEFNSASNTKRSVQQVKQAYENIKKKTKKAAATDRTEQYKTGGGVYVPVMDFLDEKLLSLLGNRATPLSNPYDSAAFYYSENVAVTSQECSCQATTSEPVTVSVADTDITTVASADDLSTASSAPTASALARPVLTASAPTVSALAASASTALAPTASMSRKRRRPAGVVRETAASAVIEAAKSQKDYYDAKLQLAREKHGAKMRILALKEQILKKKLGEE